MKIKDNIKSLKNSAKELSLEWKANSILHDQSFFSLIGLSPPTSLNDETIYQRLFILGMWEKIIKIMPQTHAKALEMLVSIMLNNHLNNKFLFLQTNKINDCLEIVRKNYDYFYDLFFVEENKEQQFIEASLGLSSIHNLSLDFSGSDKYLTLIFGSKRTENVDAFLESVNLFSFINKFEICNLEIYFIDEASASTERLIFDIYNNHVVVKQSLRRNQRIPNETLDSFSYDETFLVKSLDVALTKFPEFSDRKWAQQVKSLRLP